jgi:hypothetical protein
MIDQSGWLHRLGANRPAGAAYLTPDILIRTGPPPVPAPGGPNDDDVTRFIAFRVLPLLAEDNFRRAESAERELHKGSASLAELEEAAALVSFWAHVRDWAKAWETAKGEDLVLWLTGVRIPRQVRRGA